MTTINVAEIPLGPLSQIPIGEGRNFIAGDTEVAVFHQRGGKAYATQAFCPHKSAPLADGLTGNDMLICPFHAWKFSLRTGEPIIGSCAIKTYTIRVDENQFLYLILQEKV